MNKILFLGIFAYMSMFGMEEGDRIYQKILREEKDREREEKDRERDVLRMEEIKRTTPWRRCYPYEKRIVDAGLLYESDTGNPESIAQLLRDGADINHKSAGLGWSPLHRAIYGQNEANIAYLLEAGAEVNQATESEDTPLHWAVGACKNSRKSTRIVRLLLSKGARVNAKNQFGGTPLDEAYCFGNVRSLRLLLTHDAVTSIPYEKIWEENPSFKSNHSEMRKITQEYECEKEEKVLVASLLGSPEVALFRQWTFATTGRSMNDEEAARLFMAWKKTAE